MILNDRNVFSDHVCKSFFKYYNIYNDEVIQQNLTHDHNCDSEKNNK